MKNKTKSIKFYFFKVEKRFIAGFFGDDFQSFFKNDFSLSEQLMEIEDNKAFLQKITDNIFSFQKLRKDFLPAIKNEITGEVTHLKLKDGEAVLEQNYLYWDFVRNIIIYQSNQEGFAPTVLEKYVKWVFKDKLDAFSLKHIVRKEGIEQILNTDIISAVEFTVAAPSPRILRDLGLSLNEIADFDLSGVNTLELKITSKYKRRFLSAASLKNMLNYDENKNNFKKLKVKKRASIFEKERTFDFMDKFYYVSRENIRLDEKTKNISLSDIITILKDIYDSNIEEAAGLICSG